MTRQQRWIVAGLTMAIAATRLPALSRSLWDWDEALFTMGVRGYDVAQHHPHPPGFPLFVGAAKLVHLVVGDEFRSLQLVTLLGAMALFPALFALARALGLPFSVAAGGAALYCFFPAVWIYGGTAFSDVSATALAIAACALLLRDSRGAFIAGALVLAVAAGFRPQTLLIGCAPAIVATARRLRGGEALWPVLLTIAAAAAIVAASYTGAAYASSNPPHGYVAAMANLRDYVHRVDSFHNPARPPLRALIVEYVVHPIHSGRFDYVIDVFAAAGLVAAGRRALLLVATFLPFQLFAWLMLDPMSVSRYATAWLPLYALLAAAGAGLLRIDAVIVAAMIARLGTWTLPAVQVVRAGDAPTVAAMRSHPTFVDPGMGAFAAAGMSIVAENDLPFEPRSALYVCEGVKREGRVYARPHNALWSIVRRRYFEVSATPLGALWRFGDGWYELEGEGTSVYRWMAARSRTILPPAGPRARLTLVFAAAQPLSVSVLLNGRVVDQVRCAKARQAKSWDVDANANRPNELVLSADRAVKAAGDVRELTLRLDDYRWVALP